MTKTLAALALLALFGAGCGSKAPAETGGTVRSKALEFSACMRDNGVGEFPDPGASGELTIDGIANGSSIDTDGAVFEEALRACKDLQPAGFTGRKRNAGQQNAALRFARCIRENGVEDFPDPAAGQPLVDTRRIPSTDAPGGMAVLNAAMDACRDASAKAGVRP